MPEKTAEQIVPGDILVDADGELWEVMGIHPMKESRVLWLWSDHTPYPIHTHKIQGDQPLNVITRPQWAKENDERD
jgi:hypothetical protein